MVSIETLNEDEYHPMQAAPSAETEALEKAASIPARSEEIVDRVNATCKVDVPLRLITKEE